MNEKTETRANRKVLRGLVVSDKMEKTRVVSVDHVIKHASPCAATADFTRMTRLTNQRAAISLR